MITDRLTARVLGLLLMFLPFIIDVSTLMMTKPEGRTLRLALVVLLPSLPFFIAGALLLRKAARMKEDEGS